MICRPKHLHSGLSILEVILAFAVFMISFAGISQLITMGHDQALDASHQHTGTRLAESKLAEVEAGLIGVTESSSGTYDELPGWQWETIIGDSPAANVYEVTVRVWNANNKRVEIRLSQQIIDPNALGNAAPAQKPETDMSTTSGSGQ